MIDTQLLGKLYKTNDAEKDYEMTNIHLFIQDKNDNEALINDSYFSPEELYDDDIIEEDCFTSEELDEPSEKDNIELYTKLLVNTPYTDIDFDEEVTYEVVGSTEASPDQNKISDESPLGRAIVGKEKGETVTVESPNGEYRVKILEITK